MSTAASARGNVFLEHGDFEIRVANTRARREECSRLVNVMYSWRGYGAQSAIREASAYELTLQVSRRERVIGTLTICRDSPAGIPADALYKAEIDPYRRVGASVCELTRLAIDPAHRSKEVLDALFYHAYLHGSVYGGATDAFIEVNPRHVAFYKRLLRFQEIGEARICERVNAPAILLHRELASVVQQIAECGELARSETEAPRARLLLGATRRATAQTRAALAA